MNSGDTIAAIATAPGRGGVAIVRVSGPDAWSVAEKVSGRRVDGSCAGRFLFCRFGDTDSGLMLVFKGPHSYTGEDVVEFHCHGGTVSPRRVLDECFAAGARLARRGEFTQRAFLAGKMDLSAAEAVIDLVDARTVRAADDARARLDGKLAAVYSALYEKALDLSSEMEHLLDVSEDEIPPDTVESLERETAELRKSIQEIAATAHEGKILRNGALVVLAGVPNAGKSSLMNALLGENRAIVSSAPGTTRDFIEECLDIDGWPVRLVDTAGLRETSDEAESEGVARAEKLISGADAVVALDCEIPGAIAVHAKCDLDPVSESNPADPGKLRVSSVTGEGLDALKAAIARRISEICASSGESVATAGERQASLLAEADAALDTADFSEAVLAANALRRAAQALGEIAGRTYSADLLDSVFSRFCVGK